MSTKGRKLSERAKQNQNRGKLEYWADPERSRNHREAVGEVGRRPKSEATKRKLSVAHKGKPKPKLKAYWDDEERSEKHRETVRAVCQNRKGPNHPLWKGDRSSVGWRQSPEYWVWKKAVLKRDNYTCQELGLDCAGHLEAHHKKAPGEYPELEFDVDNGQTLCVLHHAEKHPEYYALIMARIEEVGYAV